tara:strand:- start:79 stop:471 length:393 start_codon:yes stop_codon:yes gene_type:complete
MKHNIKTALYSLRPSSFWTFYDDEENISSYDSIEWHSDNTTTAPTKDEIQAEITRLDSIERFVLLRRKRDRLLTESDWTRLDDNGLSSDKKAEWATYRQALRDLPSTADPKLDEAYDLDQSTVTWPTKPS